MAKIAFFEIEDWEKEHVKKALKRHTLFFSNDKLTERNVSKVKGFDAIAVFIYSEINKKILDKLPKLKLLTTMSTGFDHVDLEECKKRRIVICNVPTYGENTVAEHTFALILLITRKILESVERTRRGNFSLEGLRGFDLKGKTIGIIGCGNVGRHVARIAKGFEMETLIFDIKRDPKLAKQFGFKYASFNDLLKKSDIVTLHAPYNPHTHHMINKKNIGLFKKGAILINTARGGLIETEALLQALDKEIIAAAGLDVLEGECFIKEEKQLLEKRHFPPTCDLRTVLQGHILLGRDDVYITPHNAFNSKEALYRILDTTIENIQGFLKKKVVNIVKIK